MPEVKMDRNEFFSRWSPSFTQEDKSDAKAFEADLDALLQSERERAAGIAGRWVDNCKLSKRSARRG
jgi:hypothetical protein